MKRRRFLTNSALMATGLSTMVSSVTKSTPSNIKEHASSGKLIDEFELNEASISQLQDKMIRGEYSSLQITQLYLQRIEAIDKKGPRINSIIEINPEAIKIAKAMDTERKNGKIRGPLHGIPVLVKDNINTADKMMTTAGSLAMLNHIASSDAFIVKKLRDAGAVIIGKTNLSEWANFRSTNSCSGWSSRGGQTKNPYILDHNPCGSSSGSGVAVSANLCTVAVGTETDGSITCPASVCGIVGIKPTVGLLSRFGIIPISHTQDTAGPMARTVKDAAILLGILAGFDPLDPATKTQEGKAFKDYTKFLDLKGLESKKIGIEKKKYENQFLNRLLHQAIELMKSQGAEIIEIEYLEKINENAGFEFELMKYEFKYGINKYLSEAKSSVKSLKALIEFNNLNEDKLMPGFKQEILEMCEAKGDLNSKEYLDALEKSHIGTKKIIDSILQEKHLDAIAGLTMGPACSIDTIYGDRWGNVFLTAPAAMSGYPHISVPCGMVYDLPVGLSFFSSAYEEGKLISMAYSYEQSTRKRPLPKFKKSFLE